MEMNDYTADEQDQLKAMSAMHESLRKLEVLALRLNFEAYPCIRMEIDALKQSVTNEEKHMADMVDVRKINFFA